jgi:hypothetical protein
MRLITFFLTIVSVILVVVRGCNGFAQRGGNRVMMAFVALVFGLVLADPPAYAQQSQSWVSGTGNDANTCSRSAPCQTFAAAIAKTIAGGEIDCLDPGGFGAVTITKAITLDCSGAFGLIQVTGSSAINVAAGSGDHVIIRGLTLDGVNGGGASGIVFSSGTQLDVDRCLIKGFTDYRTSVARSSF